MNAMESPGSFSYHFHDTAGYLYKVLRAFKIKEKYYTEYYKSRATKDYLTMAVCVISVALAVTLTPNNMKAIVWIAAVGLLLNFIWQNLSEILHPKTSKTKWDCIKGMIFNLLLMGFVAFQLSPETLGLLPPIAYGSSFKSYLLIILGGLGCNFLFTLIQFKSRLKSTTPQPFELTYITRILKPLLEEFPKKQKCQVSFNPFPPFWSQKQDNGWDRDNILSFQIQPEPGSSLTLSIDHLMQRRISSRGKHKGYRHRTSFNLVYKNPIIEKLPPEVKQQATARVSKAVKAIKTSHQKATYQWLNLGELSKNTVKVKGKQIAIVFGTKDKNWQSELKSTDLLHPGVILETTKILTSIVAGIDFKKSK